MGKTLSLSNNRTEGTDVFFGMFYHFFEKYYTLFEITHVSISDQNKKVLLCLKH